MMKKLSAALFVTALVAIAAVATALARGNTDNATSAGMSGMAGMSHAQMLSHGGGSGENGGSGGSGRDGRRDEPGEDVSGRCDEAEHAGDADCSTSTVPSSTSRTTTSAGAAVVSGRRLMATVGSGFAITLKTPSGAPLRTLRAGTYSVVVRDLSAEHNFHLIGPGFNKASAVSTSTRRTWQVTFRRGTYTYQCDPHASMMRGSIRVR
jgi:hypothetical protein